MTSGDVQALIRGMAPAIKEFVTHRTDELRHELVVLKARVVELEQQPRMKYCGVYREGSSYLEGDVVTWDGSAWCCKLAGPRTRPGADLAGWQLMVKRGKDAT